ncbi:hypothetical protein PsYK624_146950 [Phanerochaete sordida]|uniref:BTB domain-containing protein n=1 Tax=Phanerochaete sordida TaxID=48140 RepID=A0A9P3GMD3_9APHY|nr:hypothetical protein PsYK624_146950 [Phanerochaete sordida]
MRWREVQYMLRYLYGAEEEVFDAMENVGSADELVDAVFGVMAVANELLLDRMVLLCSRVVQQRITIANATSILADASLFHATALVQSVQGYIARNLETLLECRLLDALPADLVKQLAAFVRTAQEAKAPVALAAAALARHATAQPRPTPVHPAEKRTGVVEVVDDEVFMMDGVDAIPPLSLSAPVQRSAHAGGAGRRANMKAIMADTPASGARPAAAGLSVPRSSTASEAANWRTPQRKTSVMPLTDSAPRTPTGGSLRKPVPSVSSAYLAAGGSPMQTPLMTPTMRATCTRGKGPPPPKRPNMGPVFALSKRASKQTGAALPMRRTANAAAWTLSPVQPGRGKKKTRSLMYIQAEEAARRVEEEFLK